MTTSNAFTMAQVRLATAWIAVPDRWCKPDSSAVLMVSAGQFVLVGATEVLDFAFRKRDKEWVAMFMPGLRGRGRFTMAIDDNGVFKTGTGRTQGLTAVVLNELGNALAKRALGLEMASPRQVATSDLVVPTDQGDDGNTVAPVADACSGTYVGAPVVAMRNNGLVEVVGLTVGPARAVSISAVLELAAAASNVASAAAHTVNVRA